MANQVQNTMNSTWQKNSLANLFSHLLLRIRNPKNIMQKSTSKSDEASQQHAVQAESLQSLSLDQAVREGEFFDCVYLALSAETEFFLSTWNKPEAALGQLARAIRIVAFCQCDGQESRRGVTEQIFPESLYKFLPSPLSYESLASL